MASREMLLDRIERDRELLPRIRDKANPAKDKTGVCANGLGADLRSHAIAQFVANGNKARFVDCLREAVLIASSLFTRAEKGEQIDSSFLSPLAYQDLYDALAIGDIGLAATLAQQMRYCKEGGSASLHDFDRVLGYCLRAFFLRDEHEISERLDDFRRECEKKENADFRGYVTVFEAILARDSDKANLGFIELLKGHRRQCKGNGVFRFTPDEDLCVWGLGMANLARWYGLDVRISDPLIPSELISDRAA